MILARYCSSFWKAALSPRLFCAAIDSQPTALRSHKKKSNRIKRKGFVDVKRVRAIGGNGGDGCVSFLQLWSNETAGPDGGDGGSGGHIILQACQHTSDLSRIPSVIRAEHGERGYNKDCNGSNAAHTILKVPVGTIVEDDSGKFVGELTNVGSMVILARGGAGGHGNRFFASATEQSPMVAEYGGQGESLTYTVEMRTIAHFGLVGMPNAGKSSLAQAISRAKPKVAPWPFTTIRPHLATIPYSDFSQIQVADLPGLIEGSHRNRGLGIEFLRHVARCLAIVLVVDLSDDPVTHVSLLRHEISEFSTELAEKPQLVIGNKIDLPSAKENLAALKDALKDENVIEISAKFGTNISLFLQRLKQLHDEGVRTEKEGKIS